MRALAYPSCGERGSVPVGGQRSRSVHTSEGREGTGQHAGHRAAGGEMQEGFFPTVYTTRFGSAKS